MDLSSHLLDFGQARQGHRVTAWGGAGGQCVDLCNLWGAELGAKHIWADAVDLLSAAPASDWSMTLNTPTNAPPPGAIVVWGPASASGIDPRGHCAVALVATTRVLVVLEQDFPYYSPVRWGSHDYAGVRGWLTRR